MTIKNKLMGSADEIESIDVVEIRDNLISEEPACSSHIWCPGSDIIWVRPHEISIGSFHWDFLSSVNGSDLVNGDYLLRETTMNTENSIINECTDREAIKEVTEKSPGSIVSVFSGDLLIESVGHSDVSGLMISSKKGNLAWVLHLKTEKIFHSLNRVISSINKISDEDIFVIWEFSTNFEKFQEIKELSVDISANIHWSTNWLDVRFFQ